ncbi:hypothetical protein HPB48_025206 [Haemaphysalis longicornis]|uniref:Diacylglycerol O-acyltransferase n=1 Tax=Haemaphysalis longicornis TaxID=44386 RepID=A0A9J6HA10_HAELO|nr:hypothetical protein HPB48_025206 [Haemaphysalis longicornis]
MCSVDRDSLQWILTKRGTGNAALIAVGGAQESLDAHKESSVITLTLKSRKGFVRQALVKNPPGSRLRSLQEKLKSLTGVAPAIFYGRGILQYTWGYMPFRERIVTIVGKPIRVDKKENPTQEDVDVLHDKYVASLMQLFEDYKSKYDSKDRTLRIA